MNARKTSIRADFVFVLCVLLLAANFGTAQDDQFLDFRNAADETLNIVYRRKDGNYGLIEADLS